jgi:putative ABC transport system permease protein
LVVVEVALSLVLLVQAGLLLKTFRTLQQSDPGYRPDHVLVYEIALPPAQYGSKESKIAFFQNHLERVRGLGSVVSASAVSAPPLGAHWGRFFTTLDEAAKGSNEPRDIVLQRVAFPGYLETMGVSLVAGHGFPKQDGINDGSRAIIVNETFAKRFWPGKDAVGQRTGYHNDPNTPWMTVVGVVKDVQHYGAGVPFFPGIYVPYAQEPINQMAIVIRTSVEPTRLVPTIRSLVRETDPDLAMFGVVTMEQRLSQSLWVQRLCASLFGIFAGIALALALGGIYGVFSYVVRQRTPEIGVRLTLGARRGDVLWLILRQGLALAITGIVLGLLGSLMVSPLLRSLLSGVSPFDPFTFGGVALLLGAVAAAACCIPARRATKIDPMEALRCE